MIQNDQELRATQDRVAYFQGLLAQLRVTARPDQYPAMSSGYVAEVERMQEEVMAYVTRHASQHVGAGTSCAQRNPDADLDALRDRDDFKALLRELEAMKPEAPNPEE